MSQLLTLDACDDISVVGSIGQHLAQIARAGIRIVPGFVVPSTASLVDGFANEVLRAFDSLGTDRVILRASLDVHNINGEKIRNIPRASLVDTILYMRRNAARVGRVPAIIVQEDLTAELSGTIHSINPATQDESEMLIEANIWMNDTIFSGEIEPDMVIVDKSTGVIAHESQEEEEICLEPSQIQELYRAARHIEAIFKQPVSVDWAYDNGILYILRARPLNNERMKEYEI